VAPALLSFLDYSVAKMRQNETKIVQSVAGLTPDEVWTKGSPAENAIGNLLLHLEGNIRQWILTGLAGEPDSRVRSAEFAATEGEPAALIRHFSTTVSAAIDVIRRLDSDQLAAPVSIQGFRVTGLTAVYHVVEHGSYHTGQILAAVKRMRQADLAYYSYLAESSLHHGDRTP
jgi:uncharacterized damage-inducible protein DinB